MLLFIDESGDSGLKLNSGSSKYFSVALVVFENHDEASAVDDRINLLRREMGLSDRSEFHFNKMRPEQRRRFLSAIARYNFSYWGIIINKAKLIRGSFQLQKSFYEYACDLVFEKVKPRLSNAIVVMDETGSKGFGRQFKTYLAHRLKDELGRSLIKKLKTQDSTRNNLLQMADMVVGSIARSYTDKRDATGYRKLIEQREIDVQFWPE